MDQLLVQILEAGNRDSATGALTPGSQTGTAPGTATGVGSTWQVIFTKRLVLMLSSGIYSETQLLS